MARLADSKIMTASGFIFAVLNVGGIAGTIQVFVMADTDNWYLILGRKWHPWVHTIEDHYQETMTISGLEGNSVRVTITPSPRLFKVDLKQTGCIPERYQLRIEETDNDEEDDSEYEWDDRILEELENALAKEREKARLSAHN